MQEEKIISFNRYAETIRQKEKNMGYQCFATEDRLAGFCDLLICEAGMQAAESFSLKFTPEGLIQHRYLHSGRETNAWLQERSYTKITYLQALGLLGDAVRQCYKYKTQQSLQEPRSVHLQRIWNDDYYNEESNLRWMLSCQDEMTILKTYLCALGHKDAALIYDMTVEQEREEQNREVYAYQWSHVLEDFEIFDFEIMERVAERGKEDRTFFLTIYGELNRYKVLSVDMCLRMVREQGYLRILGERVLEARRIYSR